VALDDLGTPEGTCVIPIISTRRPLTSRGCPYSCSFCYLTVFKDRKYRTIPHQTILEDFDSIQNNFAVVITDENFIAIRRRISRIEKSFLKK